MVDEEIQDYQGARLAASEAIILKKLEMQLGQPIPHPIQREENPYHEQWEPSKIEFGFNVENFYVAGIALFFGDNPYFSEILEITFTFPKLRSLILSANDLENLPETIGQLQSLEYLELDFNCLQTLPDSIGQLHNLRILSVHSNNLQSLPNSIGQLHNLKRLYLNTNQLKSLPSDIGQLKSLEYLNLEENQLNSVPESIGMLQNLQTLNLRYNRLKSIPNTVKQINDLNLYLEPNPFSLTGLLFLYDYTQGNFKNMWPSKQKLEKHPLVQPLDFNSLKLINKALCPFCGVSGLVSGREKKTDLRKIFCSECENIME
ncbi:MAG: leucine-rich repeat domain-containing protein [Candidatus Hermodarchaeota archaeon]